MKKKFLVLFLLVSTFVSAQKWETGYDVAKSKAEASNGVILLVFAGSDWCAPCIKLDRLVFQSPEFQKYADENLILYKADFPRKKVNSLSPELTKANNVLAEKFNPKGYFPLVLVLDENETILDSFGFENKSVEDYISHLNAVLK